ncbi:vesicle-associated membrane protein-associated protein B isoform X2 [Folsomia candida]|uniref:vesicle-associated membrane protein-associated protein B isoform X2 n=1 Tax=Folsomia candida TaxID=158441 RepID=UPI000B90249B|nr:vesicle-associated membrane protein-associated protein B isoform X2 [Folsomia candida]
MPEQVLRIEPDHELKFKGPFNVPSTTLLKIINPSDKRVCFKIKTTAPKRYCVRPNAGLLQPGANANIAVVFQPCELEPTANKHKFMVQALYAPDGDASIDMDSLWKDVDNTKLMDTKLRCTFENAADSGNQNDLNAFDEGKVTRAKHDHTKSQKMVSDESHGGDAANRLSVHPETVQLRQENGQLKDEIDRLKRQLKSREASGFSGMAMQTNAPATPMLQIILALVVLLVGLVMGKFFV